MKLKVGAKEFNGLNAANWQVINGENSIVIYSEQKAFHYEHIKINSLFVLESLKFSRKSTYAIYCKCQ